MKLIKRILTFLGLIKKKKVTIVEGAIDEVLAELEQYEGMNLSEEDGLDFIELEPWNGKPTVAIDFDGVIHSYTSGWNGADQIDDPPVSKLLKRSQIKYTSIDWLTELIRSDQMNIAIFSSRNNQRGGIKAMKAYLMDNGMDYDILMKIAFPEHKPPSHVLIDDRCMTFKGSFFSVGQILNFKPWIQ